jgi:hypothetical protein
VTTLAEGGPQVTGIAIVAGRQRPVQMLVDTGAEISMVAEHVLAELHSAPEAVHYVAGVFSGEPEARAVHVLTLRVHLTDGDIEVISEAYLTSMPRAEDGVDCLLGRDILTRLRFDYDGPLGTFTLTR